ncbi:MAG: class I SAM-dependent methyltransferase [Deltaproteobacteria bacterium]|nr:class I SAM-dependent methyltransferase [Deltaproteobacteria bacterium]
MTNNHALEEIPFEFCVIPREAYPIMLKYDQEEDTSFISPLLMSNIKYFDIYESSLSIFEMKCQIRDFMDLCQILQETFKRQVEGDLAEFGSWKGHSGYLISKVMKEHNVQKRLYMFDMFEEFPQETVGLDVFWNKTHQLDFEEVKENFKHIDNVTLVKGDFTKTFLDTGIKKLCFVYIDCDSYRGTKYLLNTIYDNYLCKGGVIVLEDYGNGPLLGIRVAFHEFFDQRKDCFTFFSQFSGHQIICKS